jgi:uncharacterized protein YacL
LPRHVLDASVLIDLKKGKHLRRLTGPIADRKVAVPLFVLHRLRRASHWRPWLKANESKVKVRLQTGQEHETFQKLMRRHGLPGSNPRLAADDIMAITIARCRNWPLVMRDAPAERVAQGLGVTVLHMDDFLAALEPPRTPRLL